MLYRTVSLFDKLAILGLFTMLVTSCASYDPAKHYDPNAHKMLGVVLEKKLLATPEEEKVFKTDEMLVFVPIPSGFILVPSRPIGSPSRKGDPYGYKVKLENSQEIEIINHFGGFEVGSCIQVFISPKFPIRMSSGWGCDEKNLVIHEKSLKN